MQTKYIIVAVAIFTSFALGRYTVPTKVKIETKMVEIEKTTEDKKTDIDQNKHKETTTTETITPSGEKTIVSHTVEDNKTDTEIKDQATTQKESVSTKFESITKSSSLSISLLAGIKPNLTNGIHAGPTLYGAHISKPIIGPVSIGIWGLSDGSGGFSLGLNF